MFFISLMVFSKKSDSYPQLQRNNDGYSSIAILHPRINTAKYYDALFTVNAAIQNQAQPLTLDRLALGELDPVYQCLASDNLLQLLPKISRSF